MNAARYTSVVRRALQRQQRRLAPSSIRWFGAEGEAVAKKEDGEASTTELTFSTPRVQDLYERMVKLEKEEVVMLGQIILETLDQTVDENEFYYYGIGNYGGGGGGGAGAAAEATEEVKKDTFDLKLVGFDDKSKIKVIKEVRSLAGLGLKEAKELVESAPKIIQKDLKTESAEELKEKLEAVGAQIELV